MSLGIFLDLVVLAAVVYRVARFLILDELINEWRDALHGKLADHPNKTTIKLQLLMTCPFCLTIWISILVTLAWFLGPTADWPGWAWPYYMLAVATGSLVFWRILDNED